MSLADQILGTYKSDVSSLELAPFTDGRFEVMLDGAGVFSKKESGRFPDWEEIKGTIDSTR